MTVEVLCVTMGQNDFSKFKEMNISSDVVFANQTDVCKYEEREFSGHTAKMISTNTIGVGRNRNVALIYATGDILLFADDDIRYFDDYCVGVIEAYEKFPDADMVIFSMNITKNGQIIRKISGKDKRLSVLSALKYGTYVYSIKRESWEKANMWFSTLFGGGTDFAHGEDTLFLLAALKKLNVYTSSFVLGECSKDVSTCFSGYDEKYFFDQGVLYAAAFPALAYPMALQFCIRKLKRYKQYISFRVALKNMRKGIVFYRNR